MGSRMAVAERNPGRRWRSRRTVDVHLREGDNPGIRTSIINDRAPAGLVGAAGALSLWNQAQKLAPLVWKLSVPKFDETVAVTHAVLLEFARCRYGDQALVPLDGT